MGGALGGKNQEFNGNELSLGKGSRPLAGASFIKEVF